MIDKKLFLCLTLSEHEAEPLDWILSKSNDSLLNEGICYLGRFGNSTKTDSVTHINKESVDSVQSELSEAFQKNRSEEFHTYILLDQIFNNYSDSNLDAEFHKKVLSDFSPDVEIIFFLERQDIFLESSFSKKILQNATINFEEYLNQFKDSDLDWYKLLNRYAEAFGKKCIQVHEFKKAYHNDKRKFIRQFGKIVGSKYLENYLGSISENSFSTDVLETVRLANIYMRKDEWEKMDEVFNDTAHLKNENSYFAGQQRAELLKKFEDSNTKVANKYTGEEENDFFNSSHELLKNKNDEDLLIESLTIAYTKAVLDLKNSTEELLHERKKKSPAEKIILKIWNRIRSILKK